MNSNFVTLYDSGYYLRGTLLLGFNKLKGTGDRRLMKVEKCKGRDSFVHGGLKADLN